MSGILTNHANFRLYNSYKYGTIAGSPSFPDSSKIVYQLKLVVKELVKITTVYFYIKTLESHIKEASYGKDLVGISLQVNGFPILTVPEVHFMVK